MSGFICDFFTKQVLLVDFIQACFGIDLCKTSFVNLAVWLEKQSLTVGLCQDSVRLFKFTMGFEGIGNIG